LSALAGDVEHVEWHVGEEVVEALDHVDGAGGVVVVVDGDWEASILVSNALFSFSFTWTKRPTFKYK